jgi:hypothetical protein
MLDQPQTKPRIKFKTRQRPHLAVVCEALRKTRGIVDLAARRLSMDPSNLRKFVDHHPACIAIRDEARLGMVNVAESKFFEPVDAGVRWALSLLLMTPLGASRGYGPPKGINTLSMGDTTNTTTVITLVVINSIPNSKFVRDGEFIDEPELDAVDRLPVETGDDEPPEPPGLPRA